MNARRKTIAWAGLFFPPLRQVRIDVPAAIEMQVAGVILQRNGFPIIANAAKKRQEAHAPA
jgi:hypothetical protein